jgi:uncharacterized protein (DUF1015 family)
MNINDMETVRLKRQISEMKEELDEIHAAHKQVIEERCAGDEVHCGCVAFYRLEIKRLNKIIKQHELTIEERDREELEAEMKSWCYKCDSKHDPEDKCGM